MITLQNKNVWVEYREEKKEIFARDLTDRNNEPAFYTTTKRGIKKAWKRIEELMKSEETRMYDLGKACDAEKVRTHHWCMMD